MSNLPLVANSQALLLLINQKKVIKQREKRSPDYKHQDRYRDNV